MTLALIAENAALVWLLMTLLWVVSVLKRDASIVDPWWPVGFLVVTIYTIVRTGFTPAKSLLLVAVTSWAMRLWVHLLIRNWGKAEDPRYTKFRERFGAGRYWWFSYFQVFLLQGALILLISAPLQLAGSATAPNPISGYDLLATSVFVVGLVLEVVADGQLRAFRRDPQNRGQVLAHGLWSWSRHPNYFGEAVLWWGLFLYVLDQPLGWSMFLSPLLMTFLLVKVSGVAMLDAQLTETKPHYRKYIETTSAFFPRRPKT